VDPERTKAKILKRQSSRFDVHAFSKLFQKQDLEEFENRNDEFNFMGKEKREQHIKELWVTCFVKAKAAYFILSLLCAHRVQQMQTLSIFQDIPFYLILPHKSFKIIWSLGILLIISILAIYMPFELAFLDDDVEDAPAMIVINILIDVVFIIDCVLVLITTYEKPNGLLETKPKKVIKHNLTLTYFFDLLSSFPSFIFSYFVLDKLLNT
jgi:hypothetical protein